MEWVAKYVKSRITASTVTRPLPYTYFSRFSGRHHIIFFGNMHEWRSSASPLAINDMSFIVLVMLESTPSEF
jgi:hypothetical protein